MYSGLEYLLTHTMLLEFQTNDMWYESSIPMTGTAEAEAARDVLRRMPCFVENPSHLQAMAQALRGVGSFLRRHVGKIGGALSVLFPKWDPILGPSPICWLNEEVPHRHPFLMGPTGYGRWSARVATTSRIM
jgi:hypothetical protein